MTKWAERPDSLSVIVVSYICETDRFAPNPCQLSVLGMICPFPSPLYHSKVAKQNRLYRRRRFFPPPSAPRWSLLRRESRTLGAAPPSGTRSRLGGRSPPYPELCVRT